MIELWRVPGRKSQKLEISKKCQVCGVVSFKSYVFICLARHIPHALQWDFEDFFERNVTSNWNFWVSTVHDSPCTTTNGMSIEAHGSSRAEKAQCFTRSTQGHRDTAIQPRFEQGLLKSHLVGLWYLFESDNNAQVEAIRPGAGVASHIPQINRKQVLFQCWLTIREFLCKILVSKKVLLSQPFCNFFRKWKPVFM